MAGRPVGSADLQRGGDGLPWALATPAGSTVYVPRGKVEHLARRLAGAFAPVDDPHRRADRLRDALAETFRCLHCRTRAGVLTTRDKPRSIDYLCTGRVVRSLWGHDLMTAVIRRVPAGSGGGEVLLADAGLVELLITVTPRSARWMNILDGKPLPEGMSTYELGPGDSFRPEIHCDYRSQ